VFFGVVAVLADVWSGPAKPHNCGTCDVYHYHQGTFVCRETAASPNIIFAMPPVPPPVDAILPDGKQTLAVSLPDATVSGTTSARLPEITAGAKESVPFT